MNTIQLMSALYKLGFTVPHNQKGWYKLNNPDINADISFSINGKRISFSKFKDGRCKDIMDDVKALCDQCGVYSTNEDYHKWHL